MPNRRRKHRRRRDRTGSATPTSLPEPHVCSPECGFECRHPRLALAALVSPLLLGIGGFVALELTPWFGDGLAVVLPTWKAQTAVGLALPLAVLVCLVAAGRRPAGAPFPPRLAATITSLLIGMFLIAPFGKGHGRPPATERAAPWLVITEYCSWPLLGLAAWWLRRRRHRRVGDRDAVPAGGSRTEQPADASEPSLRALVVAAGVPMSVAVVLVGLGLHAGPPPRVVAAGRAAAPLTSPSQPIRLTVPELAGTTLAPQVATVRLRDAAAIPPAVLAGDLTRGPGPTTVWESGLQIVPTEGATESSLAFLTLDRLDPRTDVGAAAAHLREDGAALDGGWVDRVAGCGCVAVLDGHDLLVLRLEHPAPDQDAQLRRLATDLTPSRRAALVDAVTGVR